MFPEGRDELQPAHIPSASCPVSTLPPRTSVLSLGATVKSHHHRIGPLYELPPHRHEQVPSDIKLLLVPGKALSGEVVQSGPTSSQPKNPASVPYRSEPFRPTLLVTLKKGSVFLPP
jgi:hypothetical protein